jgi:hypothetical protein
MASKKGTAAGRVQGNGGSFDLPAGLDNFRITAPVSTYSVSTEKPPIEK